ncbi:MAG: hypothetical protein ABI747_00565 [Candidatus Moraniibacteriota bacterium]
MAADLGGGVSVSPPFQEVVLGELGDQSFTLLIENNTETTVSLRLSALDFGSLDDSGGVAFLGGPKDLEKKYGLAEWMRPVPETLTLASGKSEQVLVSIENRDNLSPGGHYGAVILRSVGDPSLNALQNGIALDQIFSVLVYTKKVGGEKYALDLEGMDFSHGIFTLPKKVALRFQNTGNVHVVPRGTLSIMDPRGREVAHGVINEASSLILPETPRVFPQLLFPLGEAFFPGTYHLNIQYRYDGKDDFSLVSEAFFLLPPLFLVLCGGLFVMLLGYGFYRARRRKKSPRLSSLS